MFSVKMNRTSMLAAAMFGILESRLSKGLVDDFSVLVETTPDLLNDGVLYGKMISGHIEIKGVCRREFVCYFTCDSNRDIMIEVPDRTVYYPRNNKPTRIDVKEPVEINFDKRRITFKRVHTFSTKNVSWGWQEVKGTATDIIGMILREENS